MTASRTRTYGNVIGVVCFSLPKLGYISTYLTGATGKYVCGAVVAGLFVLMIVAELFKKETAREKKDERE